MTTANNTDCTIQYYSSMIVLRGGMAAVHQEANKILRRFAASARPFRVREDSGESMVLIPAN